PNSPKRPRSAGSGPGGPSTTGAPRAGVVAVMSRPPPSRRDRRTPGSSLLRGPFPPPWLWPRTGGPWWRPSYPATLRARWRRRPRLGGVDQHPVGRIRAGARPGEAGVAGRKGLDDELDPEPDEPQVLGRLAAVELGALEARPPDDVDHPLRRLVAEHADGQG